MVQAQKVSHCVNEYNKVDEIKDVVRRPLGLKMWTINNVIYSLCGIQHKCGSFE